MTSQDDQCTVMVRNLPLDLFGPELEGIFAEVAPVKKAAVIHHKKTPGVTPASRGFGFVKFALADDAMTSIAKLQGTYIRGRELKLELAQKRSGQANIEKSTGENSDAVGKSGETEPGIEETMDSHEVVQEAASSKEGHTNTMQPQHPAKVRTLRIFGIAAQTTHKQLLKRLQKMGKVEQLKILEEKKEGSSQDLAL